MKNFTKWSLCFQYFLGRLAVFIVGPLSYLASILMGYRVRDLKKIRRECLLHFKKHRGPWLICPNHLTMIDSAILAVAMLPLYRYMLQYRLLAWNLPESANFQRNLFLVIICYLAKCIPVSRGGDRDQMKSVLDKCDYLLNRKQSLMIFTEGGRSRTGRVNTESFSYGVGQFIKNHDDCHVMCVYMRGDHQDAYSDIPKIGERFTISIDTFKPETKHKGLRAQRDYAGQIIKRLSSMEETYFATCRQRHSGFDQSEHQEKESGYSFHKTGFHSR